jgi:xylitol oxidase
MSAPLLNWSQNFAYHPGHVCQPGSLDELCGLISGERSVRAIATRHTFNGMGDAEVLVGFANLPGADHITVDTAAMTVGVGPAVTFAQLAEVLNAHGLALANLASLPHISVCGAMATATHGSGDRQGNLATSVRGMRLLTASGELVVLSAGDPRLAGATVHLGALGFVLEVTLAVVPYYEVSQHVFESLEWDALLAHLDEVFALGRSVSVFHRFGPRTQAVWVKADTGTAVPPELFGAPAAQIARHPLLDGDVEAATVQLGEPGPWSERLPHFRSGFMPSDGAEIQTEVFVARSDAVAAIEALREVAEQLVPILLVGELRTVAADELWLSPQYRRDSLGLHFTWQRDPEGVAWNTSVIEHALAPFAPRPHWGKVFAMGPGELAPAYERAEDFRRLRAELDPTGTFTNAWLRQRCPFLSGH